MTDLSTYGGGLGERLLLDSLWFMVRNSLSLLGWFNSTIYDDPPGTRKHRSVEFVAEPRAWDEIIEPNLLALQVYSTVSRDVEVGNWNLTQHDDSATISVYAESEAFGTEITNDIRAILMGEYPAIGRTRSTFSVYDLGQPTPPKIGYGIINNVDGNRIPTRVKRAWLTYWYDIDFELIKYADANAQASGNWPELNNWPAINNFPEEP